MKTIIIPDLHNRTEWVEDALSSPLLRPYNNIIFLGDYFDDFNDTADDIYIAAMWLKNSLKMTNRIHLIGTHDLYYRFPYNPNIAASGNTPEKADIINNIITPSDWNKLKLFHYEQNYLISHAGIHTYLISEYVFRNRNIFNQYIIDNNTNHHQPTVTKVTAYLQLDVQKIIEKIVKPATDEALNDIYKGDTNPWLMAGFSRGGVQPFGGIVWLDWDKEFEPISYLNQILGHTEHKKPEEKSTENSKNFDIDTRNHHIGILKDKKFRWIENPYL